MPQTPSLPPQIPPPPPTYMQHVNPTPIYPQTPDVTSGVPVTHIDACRCNFRPLNQKRGPPYWEGSLALMGCHGNALVPRCESPQMTSGGQLPSSWTDRTRGSGCLHCSPRPLEYQCFITGGRHMGSSSHAPQSY